MNIPEAIQVKEGKKRHGCLTAWFVWLFIAEIVTAINIISGAMKRNYASTSTWILPLMIIASIMIIVSAIALFKWKKWGFYLYILSAIVAGISNLVYAVNRGEPLIFTLGFLVLPIGILYGVLHIGNEKNKGWPQLE